MAGLDIKINKTRAGVGVILPPPLYDLGVNDYAYRWEASRAEGTVGQPVTRIVDPISGKPMLPRTDLSAFPILMEETPGDKTSRYISFPAGATTSAIEAANATQGLIDLGLDFTAVWALWHSGTGGTPITNNAFELDGYRFGRAGNGAWQQTAASTGGSGSIASPAVSADVWHTVISVMNSDGSLNRNRVDGTTSGSGAIVPGSGTDRIILAKAGGSNELRVASLTIYKRTLSSAELDTIQQAIRTGSPLVP